MNSTVEDQKVAKYLSGWQPDETPWVPSLCMLDSPVRAGVAAFKRQLFHLATMPDVEEFKFSNDVVDMMAAIIILNYPAMAKISGNAVRASGCACAGIYRMHRK